MQTDDLTIKRILAEPCRFMVPLYQRKYQWQDKQILPFWEDVVAKTQEVLENESKFHHYMGALILAPIAETYTLGMIPKAQVVDGQQRLTTFQIFLAALREASMTLKCKDVAEKIEPYIYNAVTPENPVGASKYKLTPTPKDQDVFYDLIELSHLEVLNKYASFFHGIRVPKNTPHRALRAYFEFYKLICEFARRGDLDPEDIDDSTSGYEQAAGEVATQEDLQQRLDALLTGLIDRMKLVVITLEEEDDAQVIFETLNSKGEPLLAMDLVRNNIFYRAEKENAQVQLLYQKLWTQFDDAWWQAFAPFARPKRPRIDHFLAHVLTAETGRKISVRELYSEYRNFVAPRGQSRFENVEDELKVLTKYSPIYQTLEGLEGPSGKDSDLAYLGTKLATWQVTTAYPVAMQVAIESGLEVEEKRQLYRLIYSYIVRRSLSSLTQKNLNRVFQGLSQIFVEKGPSLEAFWGYFGERDGESTRFPDDSEFRQGLLSNPAYKLAPSARMKDVLWELELASRSKYAEKAPMPSELWVEHVLPISWTIDWPFDGDKIIDRSSDDSRVEERNRLLHSLGNLTLTDKDLNIFAGNKSFSDKQKIFNEHTALFLNKFFRDRLTWYESDIRERGEALAEFAIKIWPSE